MVYLRHEKPGCKFQQAGFPARGLAVRARRGVFAARGARGFGSDGEGGRGAGEAGRAREARRAHGGGARRGPLRGGRRHGRPPHRARRRAARREGGAHAGPSPARRQRVERDPHVDLRGRDARQEPAGDGHHGGDRPRQHALQPVAELVGLGLRALREGALPAEPRADPQLRVPFR